MKRYCVIGYPVGHSRSPAMHNAWFAALGIDATFEAREVSPEELHVFMHNFRNDFNGGNVTVPHKETVMAFLDEVDEIAQEIGAVNTLDNRDGLLVGYNTDWIGAMKALCEGGGFDPEGYDSKWLAGKTVTILGAGGAARAAAYGVHCAGGKLTVLNRTVEKAQHIADFYEGEAGSLDDFGTKRPDYIINATSVGLSSENESPVPEEAWNAIEPCVVMDMIPEEETVFLQHAKNAGCTTVTGIPMLLYQGAEAFEIWTGRKPPSVFYSSSSFSSSPPPKNSAPETSL